MQRTLLLASLLLAGVGCADADPDEDGLTNAEEEELGTDPKEADSDGDGLDDGDEVDLGTDPLVEDSDGDGFADGAEVDAGTNPTFEWSHTYTGGYNVGYCEDGVAQATGPTGAASLYYNGQTYEWTAYQEGDVLENIILVDHHGEQVSLYSFCGRVMKIVLGAFW